MPLSNKHIPSHDWPAKLTCYRKVTDCTRSCCSEDTQLNLSAEWIHVPSHVCQGSEVTCKLLLSLLILNAQDTLHLLDSHGVQAVAAVFTAGLQKNHLRSSRCWLRSLRCVVTRRSSLLRRCISSSSSTVIGSNNIMKIQRHVLVFILNGTAVITVCVNLEYIEWWTYIKIQII